MELTEVSRIVANIRALLAEASHPGKVAAAVHEAQEWLVNYHNNLEEVIKHEREKATAPSGDQSGQDEAGVGNEPAGNRRRKSRKGRKNPA